MEALMEEYQEGQNLLVQSARILNSEELSHFLLVEKSSPTAMPYFMANGSNGYSLVTPGYELQSNQQFMGAHGILNPLWKGLSV